MFLNPAFKTSTLSTVTPLQIAIGAKTGTDGPAGSVGVIGPTGSTGTAAPPVTTYTNFSTLYTATGVNEANIINSSVLPSRTNCVIFASFNYKFNAVDVSSIYATIIKSTNNFSTWTNLAGGTNTSAVTNHLYNSYPLGYNEEGTCFMQFFDTNIVPVQYAVRVNYGIDLDTSFTTTNIQLNILKTI